MKLYKYIFFSFLSTAILNSLALISWRYISALYEMKGSQTLMEFHAIVSVVLIFASIFSGLAYEANGDR